ncbi:MAG: DUF5009 domain-containing protein [Draconibacterium sp.]|nr:DUF5009 domain-containing protein [Draconibacterium sp.]
MPNKNRILTIDVMRGLTLFLMLFVNDLYVPSVPEWLTHKAADFDGMGLADWVFPGFLFMVGLAVPYAIQSRLKKGDSTFKLTTHIIIRTVSLLLIGILMLNVSRVNSELTGMHKYLWAILVYISIFLIWNEYGKLKRNYVVILKGAGFVGLLILIAIFKGGTLEETTWLQTGWWGILGIIGWGYLVASTTYLIVKDSLIKTGIVWLFFILLNVLSQLGMLSFIDFLKPAFGVIIAGNTPSIVLAGLFFSLILRKYSAKNLLQFVTIGVVLGLLTLGSGFVLRNWFIISKNMGTPSWSMICNGISILIFVTLYVIIDIFGRKKWTVIFKPAGQNSLTTYLAPDILYYTIWVSGFSILFYKQSEHAIIVVLGSIVWALLMIGFAALLSKIGIRLKL